MINYNISDQLVGALCNTLLHSLWQGIVLSVVAGLIVICTRKASSALRYNLLISALAFFAIGVSVTFVGQYRQGGGVPVAERLIQPVQLSGAHIATDAGPQTVPASQPGFTDRVYGYLSGHHNTIVLVWFLIICIRSLQLGVGLYGTYRFKRVQVRAVDDHWPERMRQLADALGIRQSITLLESGLAKVPMVIGALKPVVLVPIGLLTALRAAEVEAILIHELAHIRRRDYLVNLLQSLMEIVFFFNPAVLWVSGLIRAERENCCDDLALAQQNNRVDYMRALVSCEEYKLAAAGYAMAFAGDKNTLLGRVKRMSSNRNHSLNVFEKTVLAVCLVCAGLFAMAFSAKEVSRAEPLPKIIPVVTRPHFVAQANTKVTKAVTPRKRPGHDAIVSRPPEQQVIPGDTIVPQPVDMMEAYHNGGYQYSSKGYAGRRREYADLNQRYAADNINIKADLLKDHLIDDTNHLHFTINQNVFILNGVRQGAEVFERYKNKYVPTYGGEGWEWNHSTERN
jgi:bla regulator protein BlaR1